MKIKGPGMFRGIGLLIFASVISLSFLLISAVNSSTIIYHEIFVPLVILNIVFLLFSGLYLNWVQRQLNKTKNVLERLRRGDLNARLEIPDEELGPLAQTLNAMADKLADHITRLKKTELERKNFIANISDDLRTPLAVIKGYAEALIKWRNEQKDNQKQEEYLYLIFNKIQHVEGMILQMFDLSRMEAIDFVPAKQPFVFAGVLEEIVSLLQIDAVQKEIDLKCLGCQHLDTVFADIQMMKQAIQRLIDSAIKFASPKGEVKVSIEKTSQQLVVHVLNSGKTLTPELIRWINNNDSIIRQPLKNDLNLAIVKKVMHLHQYHFEAGYFNGWGNRFTIKMPIHQAIQ